MTVSLVYEVDILENALLRNASGQRLLYLPLDNSGLQPDHVLARLASCLINNPVLPAILLICSGAAGGIRNFLRLGRACCVGPAP